MYLIGKNFKPSLKCMIQFLLLAMSKDLINQKQVICQFYYNYQTQPMLPYANLALLLFTLLSLSLCDEWYIPDSNLISDAQFNSKIIQDKLSFKFVKYFTPHCPYCRYLKAVFDQLKHKKEWCFKIYDFNCQWYPQFCMNHVRSGSFPYTAIHDQQGNMIEEIHGFYPEPIITTIFDRIEERCLAARGTTGASQIQQAVVPEMAHQTEKNQVQPAAVEPMEYHEQPKVQSHENPTEIKTEDQLKAESHPPNHQQAEHQNKPKTAELKVEQQHTAQKHVQQPKQEHSSQSMKQVQARALNVKQNTANQHHQSTNSYHNYLFYGVCLLCAAYYVYTLHADKPNPQVEQHAKTINSTKQTARLQKQNKAEQKRSVQQQPCVEQSELLDHIPDEEL